MVGTVANKFNCFLTGIPLIITGPPGKKKLAMIFAPDFRPPARSSVNYGQSFVRPFHRCSRFSALYLNARRILRADENGLLNLIPWLFTLLPSFFLSLSHTHTHTLFLASFCDRTFAFTRLFWIILEQLAAKKVSSRFQTYVPPRDHEKDEVKKHSYVFCKLRFTHMWSKKFQIRLANPLTV